MFLTETVRRQYEQLTGRSWDTVVSADFLEGPCQEPETIDCVFYVLSAKCRLGPNSDTAALATHQVDRGTLRPWIFDLIDSYASVTKALNFDGIEPEADVPSPSPADVDTSSAAPSPGTSSSPATSVVVTDVPSPSPAADDDAAASSDDVRSGAATSVVSTDVPSSPSPADDDAAASSAAPSPGTSSSPAAASSDDARSGAAAGKGKSTSSESNLRLIEDLKGLIAREKRRRGRGFQAKSDLGEDSTSCSSPSPLLMLHLDPPSYNSENCVELQLTDPDKKHDPNMNQLLVLELPAAAIGSESTWCGLLAPALDVDSTKEGYLLCVMANRRAMPMRIRTTEGDELYIFACKDLPEAQQLHEAAMNSPDGQGVKDPWRPDFRVDLDGDCGSHRDRKVAEKATKSWRGFQHHRQLACSTVGSSGTTTFCHVHKQAPSMSKTMLSFSIPRWVLRRKQSSVCH